MSKPVMPMSPPKTGNWYFLHFTERKFISGCHVGDWHVYLWVAEQKRSYRVATFPFNKWAPFGCWLGEHEAKALCDKLNDEERRNEIARNGKEDA